MCIPRLIDVEKSLPHIQHSIVNKLKLIPVRIKILFDEIQHNTRHPSIEGDVLSNKSN